jgi:protease I
MSKHKPAPHQRPNQYDTPSEVALDQANEMSFPSSDPVATSNITRIDKAPDMDKASNDHQNRNKVRQNTPG